ncbi:head scaffolding protein [Vibrio phage D479]
MHIKEQLLEAVSQDDTQITAALDGIFESVELSEGVREKFSVVFESAIKAKAVELAESYITEAADKAEEVIAEHKQELNEAAEKYGDHIAEQMSNKLDSYLDHVVDAWMAENKLAIENGLKVSMFDNMMEGMKDLFVENNIECPEDKIDVVETMEENIQDLESQLDSVICENRKYKDYASYVEKNIVIDEATANMTESQKEKVLTLAESIRFDENFKSNLHAVIDFAAGIQLSEVEAPAKKDEDEEDDMASEKDDKKDDKKDDMKEQFVPRMSQYLSATNLS